MQNKNVLMCHIWISRSEIMTCSPPCSRSLIPAGRPDLCASRITAVNKWIHTNDGVTHTHAAMALNYYILAVAFAQGFPSPRWFRGVASIYKKATRLQAAMAAPWVQRYLLSRLKQGSPRAGSGRPWALAWLTFTCLLIATPRHTQHREASVVSSHSFPHLYPTVACCLTNESELHNIAFWKGTCKVLQYADILQLSIILNLKKTMPCCHNPN